VSVFVSVDRSDGILDLLEGMDAEPPGDQADRDRDKASHLSSWGRFRPMRGPLVAGLDHEAQGGRFVSKEELERETGSGVRVRELLGDVWNLSAEAFEKQHGSAFLLMSAAELKQPIGPRATQVRGLPGDDHASEHTAHLSLMVFPVVRTERSLFPFVTLGRTRNNDVVLPEVTVSRFHAFFKKSDDGRMILQDAGSTNGTAVNGKPVPVQGKGAPIQLKSGDNLRFGSVELTFLSAQALREFILEFDVD
jgi:hypothetical protein